MFLLQRIQRLPVSIQTAWDFLSCPLNLKYITPEYMGFNIASDVGEEKMYPGMIIRYTLKPVLNIPVNWVTEITQVREPYFFVDEQRAGPYKFWHHQHTLRKVQAGIEMQDTVHYDLPLWFLGHVIERVIVRKKLNEIFNYRANKLTEIFR